MSTFQAEEFHEKVYAITRLIPQGKVTSYGHIARLAGHPAHARMVGSALKFLQDETVPWQRVVGATGSISERGDDGAGAARQAQRLREEAVEVRETPGGGAFTGKWKVSINQYGWFPDRVNLDD